jgi:hypothetical protein
MGLFRKKKKKEVILPTQKDRYCPDWGRSIPIDSRVCPFCTKDFS